MTPLGVTLRYALLAAVWVVLSSLLLAWVVEDPQLQARLEAGKGLAFVVATSALLYFLLHSWGDRLGPADAGRRVGLHWLVLLLLAGALVAPALSFMIVKLQSPRAEESAFENLAAIAALQAGAVEQWLDEHAGDGRLLARDGTIEPRIVALSLDPGDADAARYLRDRLTALKLQQRYQAIMVLGQDDSRLLQLGETGIDDASLERWLAAARHHEGGQYSELQPDGTRGLSFATIVPFFRDDGRAQAYLGAIVLQLHPGDSPLPLVQPWPLAQRSGTALLVNPELAAAVRLGHAAKPGAAEVRQVVPMDWHPGLGRLVGGDRSSGALRDTAVAGAPVLVAHHAVAGTGWYLLAGLERAEVMAPLYDLVFWVNVVTAVALTVVLLLLLILWRQQQRVQAFELAAAEARSEARYRSLFERNRAPMIIYDPDGGSIVDANQAAVEFYGWSRDEVPGMSIGQVIVTAERAGNAGGQPESSGRGGYEDARHQLGDGSVREVEVYSGPINVGGREISYAIIHDVTQRRRAQLALADSEARFRAVVEAAPDAIFLQTANRFAYLNPACCRLFGASSRSELLHQPVMDRFHPDCHAAVEIRMQRLLERNEPQAPAEEVWIRLDGSEIHVEASAVPVRYRGKDGALVFVRDLSERRASEKRLDANARLIDLASMMARIGGWEVDLATMEPSWSDEVCRIHGVPAGTQVTAEQAIAFYAPEWRQRFVEVMEACARSGSPFDEELQIITAQGERAWVRVIGQAVRSEAGLIVRVQGAFQDVSEIRATYEKLASSEAKLSAITGTTTDVIVMVDDAMRFVYCNPAVGRMLGYEPEELLGCSLHDLLAPERYRERIAEGHKAFRDSGTGPIFAGVHELEALHRDGHEVPIELSVSALRLDGRWHAVGVMRDVTQRQRAEQELRILSRAVEQSSESIVITDLVPQITYVNDGFTRITGFTREEVVGRDPSFLASGRTPDSVYREMWAELRAGRPWKGELVNRRKDGSELVESTVISPIRQADGRVTHYVAVKENVTERRRISDELEHYRSHLEELVAQRTTELAEARIQAESANSAKSAFLANMSHEIRTPMNGVLGMVEALTRTRLSEAQRDMVNTINESGKALIGVIDDILDFSKIEANRLEIDLAPVSIRELVEGLCDSLVPVAAEHGVTLTLFVAPEIPPRVLTDEVRLRQMLYNLVGNGIKFSGGRDGVRGRVAVRVEMTGSEPLRLELVIEDNGVGISRETMSQLFTPFFSKGDVSTTRRFRGTGLGLPICKRIVELMHGELRVDSTPGQGSTFTVSLPVGQVAEQPMPPRTNVAGLDCLIVESPDYEFRGLQRHLEHAGARVRVASGLSAAMEIAAGVGVCVLIQHLAAGQEYQPLPGDAPRSIRQVLIVGLGGETPVDEEFDGVAVDELTLRANALLHAVAVAGGRASPERSYHERDFEAELTAPPTVEEADATGRLILVAEDDDINQKVILAQLSQLGYAAEVANDGAEALRRWRAGRHALLLTDLHMPVMDGYTLTRTIREEEAERMRGGQPVERIPIVALTANALRGEAERAKALGIDDYLTKPLRLERLHAALVNWMPPEGDGMAPDFDVAVLEDLVGGEGEVVRQLLGDYLESLRSARAELESAFESGDLAVVAAISHRLKSSSRSVGAMALGHLCSDLERAAKSGDGKAVQGQAGTLATRATDAERAIRNHLGAVTS